jgi:hypothetical protein
MSEKDCEMDNVIKLHNRPKLDLKKYGEEVICRHRSIEVGSYDREVRCQNCHAQLDPVDIIIQYAREERHLEVFKTKAGSIEKRIYDLEKQERNIKARIKNAEKRLCKIG